ncbi:MAG: hypothetical protein IJL93_05435, partial [Bacteroidales bacterium]|nr:hypothetical protein [Bacteroidales bacterium]
MLGILALPSLLFVLLSNGRAQDAIVRQFQSRISDWMGSEVSYSHAGLSNGNKIALQDLCIKDYRNDTMLYASHVIVRARAVQLLQKRFVIQKIIFDNADIRLRSDSILNLTPLVRRLTSGRENPPEHKMQLNLQDIEFTDSRFAYTVTDAIPDSGAVGVNFSDIRLDGMQLHITDLTPLDTGGVTFRIDRLAGVEQSGLDLRDLSADLFLDGQHMAF